MRRISLRRGRISLVFASWLLGSFLSGCGDSSKVSGTQVEMSEEAKAQLNSRREMYREKNKQKAAQAKGRRKGAANASSARKS